MSGWSKVNKELWLLLLLFIIAAVCNLLVASHRMVLGFYILPTLFSAYLYGRRHATLTALASVILVGLLTYFNPMLPQGRMFVVTNDTWFDLAVWGGTLIVIAYLMGTLYERKEAHMRELRASYDGILLILQHMATDDKYSTNHPYRVSVCATRIAETLELDARRTEDIRAAALLHDVRKLGISRDLLYKAANITEADYAKIRRDGRQAAGNQPGGSLRRVIPIILAHEELSASPTPEALAKALLEARILQVADAYDSIAGGGSASKSPFETLAQIRKRSGVDLDSGVVNALIAALGPPAETAVTAAH